MPRDESHLTTRFATTEADRISAERLRYRVFVEELGGDGALVDHGQKRERDRYDEHAQHLVLVDETRPEHELDHVVGVYRLLDEAGAEAAGGFYTDGEYDLSRLRASGLPMLELGRSCLDRDQRGGTGIHQLWNALADYVVERDIRILFGVASFHGTDPARVAASLSLLHARHLAPEAFRVRSRAYQAMDLMPLDALDRTEAMREVPALIKSYLRLGGTVGDGAFIDHAFNTIDVCLILDTEALSPRAEALYRAVRA
ncbi:MAG: GNAT family N-acyltransferase [Pseudomonadota bacterium]